MRKDKDGHNVGIETLVHVGQFLGEFIEKISNDE